MKLVTVVKNALNGDIDTVDVAIRRTLFAIANELDEQSDQWDARLLMLSTEIAGGVSSVREEVRSVRRLLVGLTSTVIAGIIVGIVNVAVTL